MDMSSDLNLAVPALSAVVPSGAKAGPGGVKQAAQEFESVFMTTMLSQMFEGVKTDGPFGGGQSEQMYRSLLIEQYGANIAAAGGIGIADDVARELISIQEASNDK
jgi:peptidoglycan hydrolase FlgJ